MKKLFTLFALLVGIASGAWADQTVLNPTGTTQLHAGEPTTVKYDSEATSWTCTISSASQNAFKNDNSNYGGSYVVITQFDAASTLEGKTLTKAILSWNSICTVASKNSAVNLWSIGTNWDPTTATWNNTNSGSIINGSIIYTTSSIGTSLTACEYDVTSILTNDLDKVVGFGFSTATGREQRISNIKLTLTYTSETVYTATFNESNSLTPSVRIFSDEARTNPVINGALLDKQTYYYTATLAGYNDYQGSFTVDGANPTVNFTMTEMPKITFVVKAVDPSSNEIKEIYRKENCIEGESITIGCPMYLTDANNLVTHKISGANNRNFTATEAGATVPYTVYAGVAYFVEAEATGSAYEYSDAKLSGGKGLYGGNFASVEKGAYNVKTIPTTGVYTIKYGAFSRNVNQNSYFYLYKGGNTIATSVNIKSSINGYAEYSNNGIELIAGDNVTMHASSSNLVVDYVLFERTGDVSYTKTLGTTGFGTFSAACNVAVPAGVTVYESTLEGETLTATPCVATVIPANTGVIFNFKAEADAEVTFTATETAGSTITTALTAAPAGITSEGNIYALLKNENTFAKVMNGVTLGANTAYLSIQASGAKNVRFVVDDATGIENVTSPYATNKVVKHFSNGQLIIEKNGKMYNAAGVEMK